MKRIGPGKTASCRRNEHTSAQSIALALDKVRLSAVVADRLLLIRVKGVLVDIPEYVEQVLARGGGWCPSLQVIPVGFAAVSDVTGHDWAGAATHNSRSPLLVGFFENSRPQFIQLQHVISPGLCQRLSQRRQFLTPALPSSLSGAARLSRIGTLHPATRHSCHRF